MIMMILIINSNNDINNNNNSWAPGSQAAFGRPPELGGRVHCPESEPTIINII